MRRRIGCLAMVVALLGAAASAQQEDAVMRAMRDEMARSMKDLKLPDSPKPYFVAYRVDQVQLDPIGASLGSLLPRGAHAVDMIGVEVRVGDPAMDNTNFITLASARRGPGALMHGVRIGPLQDDYAAMRRELWRATDDEYKRAVEDYAAKRAVLEGRKISEPIADFSSEPPAHWSEARPAATTDARQAEDLARELSAAFRRYPELYASSVEITLRSAYTRYLNSEGSWFARPDSEVKLDIKAETQAEDGMPLGDSYEVFAASLSGLPSKADLLARIDALGARLQRLRGVQTLSRYSGPVLFEGDAAAEVFAKVFAPALVAVRHPLTDNSQFEMMFDRMLGQSGSLVDRMGARVLPATLTVVNDPTLTEIGGRRLPVSMSIDDEGVPTRKQTLVEHGILRALLTTRTPVPGNLQSSGSRRGFSAAPTTLLVTADKTLSAAELRQELLRMAKQRGLDYAIVVRRVGRGKLSESLMDMAVRMAGREASGTDSILETYKVYSDGREELVRGAQVEGLSVAGFRDIAAVGDKPLLYNDEFLPQVGASFFSGFATSAASGLPVVNYYVPSLLFEDVSLKPAQGPYPALPVSPPPLMQATAAP